MGTSLAGLTLGIDPGITTTGYGLVSYCNGELMLVDHGVLIAPSGASLPQRLQAIHNGLIEVIEHFHPTEVAVEELFFSKNVKTALAVGEARGVAILAAAECGLPVSEYTPLEVKQAIVGYGRARKEQIQRMVQALLNLDFIPQPDDAADALAIAICHSNTREKIELIKSSTEEEDIPLGGRH